MDWLIEDINCEMFVIICDNHVFIRHKDRIITKTSKSIVPDRGYEKLIVDNANSITALILSHESQKCSWDVFYQRYTHIMNSVIEKANILELDNHFDGFKPVSAAFGVINENSCLIAFNNLTNTGAAIKRFSREIWFQIRLYAAIMNHLCSSEVERIKASCEESSN